VRADGGRVAVGTEGAFGHGGAGNFGEDEGKFFDLRVGGGIEAGEREAVEGAVLVGGEEPSFIVEGESDPGALVLLGDGVEEFNFEAGGN